MIRKDGLVIGSVAITGSESGGDITRWCRRFSLAMMRPGES